MLFFFQAEDGIRDLVRSRGLGDVYKRQDMGRAVPEINHPQRQLLLRRLTGPALHPQCRRRPVSYTHLTLPTSDLV